MSWNVEAFRADYRRRGTSASSNSYVAYLNRTDAVLGGLDEMLTRHGPVYTLTTAEAVSAERFGGTKRKSNSLSALRRYLAFINSASTAEPSGKARSTIDGGKPKVIGMAKPAGAGFSELGNADLDGLLEEIRSIAVRYRRLTGKPLGVTGEVAELTAARLLGLHLCDARTPGYDALNPENGLRRIQIKGRAVAADDRYRGRCPAIKCGDLFDDVLLVLLDQNTLLPLEIWLADEPAVAAKLAEPGSRARNERASLAIAQFKALSRRVWSVGG